jgi:DNA mismatch endonuclease, patch repair protein
MTTQATHSNSSGCRAARPAAMTQRTETAPANAYDRSAVMRAVKSRDTGPERAVRALLHPIAPGYRLHRGDLPGKPDIVYASRKLAIFVHGCFWHGHDCARGARAPRTNAAYWHAKIARNRARDAKTLAAYVTMGWRTLVVFECELKDRIALGARLEQALGGAARPLREQPLEPPGGVSARIDTPKDRAQRPARRAPLF